MNRAWKRLTDAILEPVTTAEAKVHLRVTDSTDDTLIARAITAARQAIEDYLHFGLLTQTWKYVQDVFTDEIRLPMAGTLQSVTVQYYDAAGAIQTLATSVYLVDTMSEPGRITLAPNQVWPTTQAGRAHAVVVTYVVGATEAADVRADIIDALLMSVGDFYEHRENTVLGTTATVLPTGAESKLAPLRIWWSAPAGDQ